MKQFMAALFVFNIIFAEAVNAHNNNTTMPVQDSITVAGEGFIDAEPDMLDLHINLTATKKSLKEAKKEVDRYYRAALKTVKQHNIADVDIKLMRINSQIEYDWNNDKRTFKGYLVNRSLQISVRDLNVYPDLLQSLVDAGIASINNAVARFSDNSVIKQKALAAAVKSAQRKAEALAQQFGRTLGQVIYIAETNVSTPGFQPMHDRVGEFSLETKAIGAPPAMFGTQRISANITVMYQLK